MHDVSVSDDLFLSLSLSLSLSLLHQVRPKRTPWPKEVQLLYPLSFPTFLMSSVPCNLRSLLPPSSTSSPSSTPPSSPPPPLSRSGSCSWSNTPCCGWSNGTKSGVSVRFGPLQPATASWIQSASRHRRGNQRHSVLLRGGSLFRMIDRFYALSVSLLVVFPVWRWMLIKDWWQRAVVNWNFFQCDKFTVTFPIIF